MNQELSQVIVPALTLVLGIAQGLIAYFLKRLIADVDKRLCSHAAAMEKSRETSDHKTKETWTRIEKLVGGLDERISLIKEIIYTIQREQAVAEATLDFKVKDLKKDIDAAHALIREQRQKIDILRQV